MEVVINSWYAINWKFKKRNLKQPKNVSCWSPLPRLPGEYTYLIWGGCRGVCGVSLQESIPASTVWPTHRQQITSDTCMPRVFCTHMVILTSHGGAPIQRNPMTRKGWDKAWQTHQPSSTFLHLVTKTQTFWGSKSPRQKLCWAQGA